MKRLLALVAAVIVFVANAAQSQAAIITQHTTGGASASFLFTGQSLTTPGVGEWNNLTFNFFDNINPATNPSAAGSLFLLSQQYLGLPGGLSAATPGFIAQSTGIVGNEWVFASGVTLQPNTQYFFYTNTPLFVSGANFNSFAGGNAFVSNNAGSPYSSFIGDANFRLQGTLTPEPATLAVFGLMAAGAFGVRRRLKATV